ncbi:nascent polypeptide-associated complex subunit alpha, muscle-specific form-like isoform X1 [Penaeus chinensis]|uniref:nascent polypeptide-associated complex subunit alpha, muscle-specific form-like isoform X1 n=1 Tax=Penaeus chinensis TaxID=139456 RepID=UPI001FB7BBCB|nr:nascent polypeptide-associated complex subunit alpha, muscle-specific form-like isoform X1 [Penaeus chinensis]
MMAATAAWEGTGRPPTDELQTPPGRSAQPPLGASAGTTPTLLHDSAQSTAKDSPATGKKDVRSTVRVTVNLPVSTPTGTKLAVTTRSESPAGGEGLKVEPKNLDQEKEIALSQLQELEEAIKVRKVTKVDGRKIRWIEYRARKKQEEQEKAAEAKKKGRRSKGVENSENDSTIVNNNNNNKSESNMKVEVVSPPLSVVGRSNVLESMKQQFLQGTENVGEPIANGKTDNQTETVETNQKRKSGRTRKSVNAQKGSSPKGNTPKNTTPKGSTLKESNGKGVNRRSATPKGVASKGGQKGTVNTPDSSATNSPVIVNTPATSPPVTPITPDQPLSATLKKPFFPVRSLTKGLREVRKVENGESPKKSDDRTPIPASSPITPVSIPTSTPVISQPKTEPGTKCPLIAVAARLLSPPSARSKSLDNARSRKANTRGGGKKPSGKGAERSESEPRSIMNGHTLVQNGPSEEEESISFNVSSSDAEEKCTEIVEEKTEANVELESYQNTEVTPDEKVMEENLDVSVKEEEIEPKSADSTVDGELPDLDNSYETDTPNRRGRGRPPKRKYGSVKSAESGISSGKSSKKLSTVVVDVHNSMNGEPQTVVSASKPALRGKKTSPTKKLKKGIVLPGGTDTEDTKDSSPASKNQARLSDESTEDSSQVKDLASVPSVSDAKKSKSSTGKKQTVPIVTGEEKEDDNTSASMSNQTPQLQESIQSTKLVKGVQKVINQEVPSEAESVTATASSNDSKSANSVKESGVPTKQENKTDDVADGQMVREGLGVSESENLTEQENCKDKSEIPVEKAKKVSKAQVKKGSSVPKASVQVSGLQLVERENNTNNKTPLPVGKSKKAPKAQTKKSSTGSKGTVTPKASEKSSPAKKKVAGPSKKAKSPKNTQTPHAKLPELNSAKKQKPVMEVETLHIEPNESPIVERKAEVDNEIKRQEVAEEESVVNVNVKEGSEAVEEVENVIEEKPVELQVVTESQVIKDTEHVNKDTEQVDKETEHVNKETVQVMKDTEQEDKDTEQLVPVVEEDKNKKTIEEVKLLEDEPPAEAQKEEQLILQDDVEIKRENLLKENNNLPEKQPEPEVQIMSDVQENLTIVKVTEDTVQKDTSKDESIPENPEVLVDNQEENISDEQAQESSIIPKQNGSITSQDVIGVSPSTTSISPETSASNAKSKEKVPRILKQLLQDEGVQNMLKSMGEESITAPEGSPSESSVHKLRPKRPSEPMLSSSPELDVLEAFFSPTTKKKKQRSEVDNLYMDEGVLNLLTSLEPYSRRQPHQDDAASDISQASSAKSVKGNKSSKAALDVQADGRKRKLSGASTVSNTSTRSMQPPESKKPRLDNQESPLGDPYELDTAEEFKDLSESQETSNVEPVPAQPVRKRGRPTLPLSVKQKNKAIRMQLKLQKQKQMRVNSVVSALLREDDNMNLAQIKDVLKRAREAFSYPSEEEEVVTEETPTGKAVPPIKIKLASESVTIRHIARPGPVQGQQTAAAAPLGGAVDVQGIKPTPKPMAVDASCSRPLAKTVTETRISPKTYAEKTRTYPERRTPPPQQRRIENITSPTAASFSSLVKTLEATGQQKSRQRAGGESLRQSQRASVRQSEGSYHYRDISLRKFNNFTQIILSPSTTKMKNALNSRVLRELCEALNILKRDDSVRMVLLTATGSTFCQGIDLTALQHPNLETRKKNAENLVRGIKDFLKALVQFPKPIVAGVNGNAMGLGVTMLPLFDMVIANDKAEFYLPYAKLGQVPEGGATYTFPSILGKLQSTQLFLGHKVTAAKAQEMGLASESIWPATYQQELIPKVALLASQSAQSMEATKALMNHHLVTKLELSLESECRLLLQQWTSPHFTHLCKRFLESHHVQLQKPVNLPL